MDAESMKQMLRTFKDELRKDLSEELTAKLTTLSKEIRDEIKVQTSNLKEEVSKQGDRIRQLEKEVRKRNIIIHGVEDDKNENTEKFAFGFIRSKLGVDINDCELDFAERIGLFKSNSNRPIIIGLTTCRRKAEILSKRTLLKGSNIYLAEDYPKEVQEIRKNLRVEMISARKEGKYAILKYDKLIVLEKEKSRRKRELSSSPQSTIHANKRHQQNIECRES
ncbi:hypothetical protein LSTR_LSTR015674 [Laodelphax striatellus]|uniref:Endonuclease-reverse transcriptase n=1 Tax=Laodelphax striatellus TaxID=195883 RepID=A0A482WHS9_LAOST|nr:hypothetical protein LSTR_LSTR015674 [Laodelphax striatellus]